MSTEVVAPSEFAEVLVVGGGIVGVCTAWFLAERGARVVVVERGEIASGCSYGNAGWICPSHSIPIPRPGLLRDSFRFVSDRRSPLYVRPRLEARFGRWLWRMLRSLQERRKRQSQPGPSVTFGSSSTARR